MRISVGHADLEALHSGRRGKAGGITLKVNDHAIRVGQPGIHLPLFQGEAPADTAVVAREIRKVVQVEYFTAGSDRLTSRATETETLDRETPALALIIQHARSSRCGTIIGDRLELNPNSSRRRSARRRGGGSASSNEQCRQTGERGFQGKPQEGIGRCCTHDLDFSGSCISWLRAAPEDAKTLPGLLEESCRRMAWGKTHAPHLQTQRHGALNRFRPSTRLPAGPGNFPDDRPAVPVP